MYVKPTSSSASRVSIIAALLCLSAPNFAAALDLPKPPQPELQALVTRFDKDYAMVTKEGEKFFRPKTMAQWPCDISPITILTAAELTLSDPNEAEKLRVRTRKALREQGMDTGKGTPMVQYSNVRISPVAATCKGGKIDGEVELLAEYETTQEIKNTMQLPGKLITSTMKNDTQEASRVWVRFNAGQVAEPIKKIVNIHRKMDMKYDDEAMNEATANAYPASGWQEFEISYAKGDPYILKDRFGRVLSGTFTVRTFPNTSLNSVFNLPAAQGKYKSIVYSDGEWNMTVQGGMKEGKQHGEQISLMKNTIINGKSIAEHMEGAHVVSVDGKDMIETRKCFINGLEIKTPNCPKD